MNKRRQILKCLHHHSIRIVLVIVVFSSCVSSQKGQLNIFSNQSNCNQQNIYNYEVEDLPKPIHEIALDTMLTANFSSNSLNIANAIGTLDLLKVFMSKKKEYRANKLLENRIELIEIHQKINQKIDLASLEISAVSSEIDCEEERADQIAFYMKNKEADTESKLTVGTIIAGATGSVVTGVLAAKNTKGNLADIVGITSGVVEAVLGFLILKQSPGIDFFHVRNVLKDIWEGNPTSELFPPSIWYYLNYYNPNEPNKPPLREQMINSWMEFGQIQSNKKEKNKKPIDIYFGEGGKYTADQLKNRAKMYDQLESVIKLMKQDLKELMYEIDKQT
ncbi:MAG TPA: hypothetical protein PKW69_07080 [Niabella sp.]|nr:hypothetical protein [Niabella sp.]